MIGARVGEGIRSARLEVEYTLTNLQTIAKKMTQKHYAVCSICRYLIVLLNYGDSKLKSFKFFFKIFLQLQYATNLLTSRIIQYYSLTLCQTFECVLQQGVDIYLGVLVQHLQKIVTHKSGCLQHIITYNQSGEIFPLKKYLLQT